jgi:N-formylglutamate deformylase
MSKRVYTILNRTPSLPVILHIPHAATLIPVELEPAWLVPRVEVEGEIRALTDWYTDELYAPFLAVGGAGIRYGYSRFVLDPERFEDDAKEAMAERGMGVVYTRGVRGTPLRPLPTSSEREALLRMIYWPYHEALAGLVAESLRRFGRAVIIDGHSYPAVALPYELDPSAPRPAICLGTVDQSPEALVRIFEQTVRGRGLSVARNVPFAGSIVPPAYGGDPAVMSIMIEANRSLYLDGSTAEKTAGFGETVSLMRSLAERLQEWLSGA